jgi:hypothetical protein
MRERSYIILSILLLIITLVGAYFFWQHQKKNAQPAEEPQTQEEQTFLDIAPQTDCTNDCQEYQSDQEKYNYCRSVCGFTVEDGVVKLPTSNDPVLSQDYQTKEAAISEKNIEKCGEIKDGNIKKTCQARVTEDMLDAQGGNGF